MNSLTNYELKFHNTTFHPVVDGGSIWLTSTELAKALGYADTKAVSILYNRNQDEFTPGMSLVINMTTNGINNSLRKKKVRVFSIRGAHLIAMFSDTPVAKEFRRWVLDILDREVAHGNVPSDFDFHNAANAARSINHLLSEIKDIWRGGLEDALRLMEYKSRGDISDRLAYMTFITLPLEKALVKEDRKGRIH
ncbi:hypothetical protein CKQ53_13195 [Lonsdalea britannica]|uniref:Bro-N domain-containing protein n=2 Tax=Lonsdalea britannica TaxID=1082704 RepID=A0AAD0SP28_9GAMM|nr:BRO family protein [Lonsdalea britannica]AXW88853.1 hypothetical protein CKQ53_13195 [Lonsdalea britannica]